MWYDKREKLENFPQESSPESKKIKIVTCIDGVWNETNQHCLQFYFPGYQSAAQNMWHAYIIWHFN